MSSLFDISDAEVDNAEALIIAALRADHPHLDLRRGTVLRDLLVRPAAQLHARHVQSTNAILNKRALSILAADPNASAADVNAILSNFGMTLLSGARASGTLRVRVSTPADITLVPDTVFTGPTGKTYSPASTENVIVSRVGGDVLLRPGNAAGDYYFFDINVVATEAGTDAELAAGATVSADAGQIPQFISADTLTAISRGVAPETAAEAAARIPAAISARSPANAAGINAILSDPQHGNFTSLRHTSVVTAGAAMQRRGRVNALGIAVPGHVDCYVRDFGAPAYVRVEKTATRISDNAYKITLAPEDAPGFLFIAGITDADADGVSQLGSYPFTQLLTYASAGNDNHMVDASDATTFAGTVYQGAELTVTNVAHDAATLTMQVVACVCPGISAMHAYLTSDAVRPFYDLLVRAPRAARVSVSATVEASAGFDVAAAARSVVDFVNSTGFDGRILGSDITSVLIAAGAKSVELGNAGSGGLNLTARIPQLDGSETGISGRTLRLEHAADATQLIHKTTTVFVADLDSVTLRVREVA